MKKIFAIACIALVLSGCGIVGTRQKEEAKPTLPASGLFKTVDAGETWSQKSALYILSAPTRTLAYSRITFFIFDPQDSNTIYLGTDRGIYYSYNRGEGWFHTVPGPGIVNSLAVDPYNKCTLYAAVHNAIYKSADCARTWDKIHFSSLTGEFFTTVLVSRSDSSRVWVGSSKGTLLESRNGGVSWQVNQYIQDSTITSFVQHPFDANVVYMVSPKLGIQRTADGATWVKLNELPVHNADGTPMLKKNGTTSLLRELSGANTYYDLKFDTSQAEGLLYASAYGIFRLINGEYWQEIEILNKPKQQKILTIAVDGATGQNIYFGTLGAFYRSENSGIDWSVRNLPATGQPQFMLLFPDNNKEVYVGFNAPPQ